MYSQKYCLVQLLDSLALGSEFRSQNWPLHCTIAGVFALDWTDDLKKDYAALVRKRAIFSSKVTGIDYFGSDQSIKVRLLSLTDNLYELHDATVEFIYGHGGRFNQPHYLRQDFRPHITMRDDRPSKNKTVLFNQLALIDMFPDGDHTRRRVIDSFILATGQES